MVVPENGNLSDDELEDDYDDTDDDPDFVQQINEEDSEEDTPLTPPAKRRKGTVYSVFVKFVQYFSKPTHRSFFLRQSAREN